MLTFARRGAAAERVATFATVEKRAAKKGRLADLFEQELRASGVSEGPGKNIKKRYFEDFKRLKKGHGLEAP